MAYFLVLCGIPTMRKRIDVKHLLIAFRLNKLLLSRVATLLLFKYVLLIVLHLRKM